MKRRSLIGTAQAVLMLALATAGAVPPALAQPTSASPTAPTTPNYLHAAGLSPTEIHLEWSRSAAPARAGQPLSLLDGYRVFRDGALIASVAPATLRYLDTGLSPDSAHDYQVVAVNVDGETSQAVTASASTLPQLPAVGGTSAHPRLVSPPDALDRLAAGGPEWDAYRSYCDSRLSSLIAPGYAGWDWRDAAVNYGTCYQVAVRQGDPVRAAAYAQKGLAMLAVLARHHNGGTPDARVQPLGQGDGSRLLFSLPFAPMDPAAVEVFLVPTREIAVVRSAAASDPLGVFAPITKVSNSPGGPPDYAPGDYRALYRDGLDVYRLSWSGPGPAVGATYHVSVADGELVPASAASWAVNGTSLAFSEAPGTAQTVMVRYLGAAYEQTGNGLGGVNAVQPDGPGYPMRTFNVGLALGYDLLHDAPGFDSALKAEFSEALNRELDWYTAGGYENTGDVGNYFIRGYLTGSFATAYATDGENPRAAEWKALANALLLRTYAGMARTLPGGYGPQGQYANGTSIDVLQVLSLYRDVTGLDLLSRLEWTDHVVEATIHGTKPGLHTFYDGGDWSELPAVPLTGALGGFLQYRPDHASAPFARHLLGETGQPSAGPVADYRQAYPPGYLAQLSGPLYARSDWGPDATWMSLAAGRIVVDHQHQDQGHFTINRAGDDLLVDAGGYDFSSSIYHNTFLIDDRGAGDVSVYPPSQAWWGLDAQLVKFALGDGFAYGQADFADAYVNNSRTANSVRRALRSVLFLHPGVFVVFDQVQTARPDVKKTFNLNFGGTLESVDGLHVATVGASKLFLQTVLPAGITPAIAPLAGGGITSTNYQETRSGSFDDIFLHVFQATDAAASGMSQGRLMRSVDTLAQGVEVAAGGQLWVALFAARDLALGGAVQYVVPGAGAHRHVVNDLLPDNHYVVSVTDLQGVVSRTLSLATDRNGTLRFDSDAGEAAFHVAPGSTPPASVPPIVGNPNSPTYTPPVPAPTPAQAPLGSFPSSSGGRYVALVSPTDGETFSGPLSLRLVAAGYDPLVFVNEPVQGRGTNAAQVRFYLDDTLLFEQQGGDAEYDIFKGYVSGLSVAPGLHQLRARASFVNPSLHLDSEPISILVESPAYAQTVDLTEDVVLSGSASYALAGTPTGRIRLNGNGHRIVSTGTSGGLTLSFVDVFDLGSVTDTASPGIDLTTTGSLLIEDSSFERSNGLRLRLDGPATASIERNVFRSNLRVPIGQQPVPPSTEPALAISGTSTSPKTLAGNRLAAGPIVFEQASHWTIGGSTDAASNLLIGPRTALELRDCSEMTVRGNFVHHVYHGGWSQGQLLELHGTAPVLVEHNVLMDSSWPVRGIAGEFRYNLVLEAGHEWLVPADAAFVHHNVFVGGDNDRGGITGQYDLAGIRIENNTFDGLSGSRMRAGVSWLAGSATLRSNLFLGVPAEAVAAVEVTAGALDTDYNAFAGSNPTTYSDGRTPAHDVAAHPKLHGPLPNTTFDLDEAAVWKQQLPVSAILSTYRSRYAPTQASPLLEAGDPAGGAGNDIGAIGGGAVNAADRFGSFGDPAWTPPPTPATPQNQAPSVVITQPASGSAFTAPASITVAAAASDPDGGVVRVDFLLDGSVVASDTTAPFTASLGGLAAGSYAIVARAVDDSGATTTSGAVSVTVSNGTGPSEPPITVGQHGENLLSDPGFESGLAGFWAQNSADTLERVSLDPITGAASLRVTVNGGWDNFWSSLPVEGTNLAHGSRLTLSAKVRAGTASSNTRLSLCAALYYQSGEWLQASSCTLGSGAVGSVETLTSSVAIDPARPLRILHFYLKSEGPGPVTYSLDDVSMVLAAPDADPGDPDDPPAPPAPSAGAYEQNLVADPGFELGVSAFSAQNPDDVISQTAVSPLSGSASLQMVVNGGWDNFWMWRTVEGTPLEFGGQLTVSARVRAETAATGTPLRLCAALYYQSDEWAEAPVCGTSSGVAGEVETLTSSLTIDPSRPIRVLYLYLKSDGPGSVTYTVDDVSIVLSRHGHGQNVLEDPGFESAVAGFSAQNPADLVSQVSTNPISGTHSLQVEVNGGWDNFWMWETVEGTNLAYGSQLTVSAQVRSETPGSTPLRLCAALYYQSGDWAEASSCGSSSGTPGQVETLTSTLVVDPATPLRVLYFYLKGDGPGGVTYTLDDVSMVLSAHN